MTSREPRGAPVEPSARGIRGFYQTSRAPGGQLPGGRPGGGLPGGRAKVEAVDRMFDAIAPRYDLLNRLLTFSLDVRWRRRTVAALALDPGSVVIDAACGTGDLCCELAAAGLRCIGVDRSAGMLSHARTDAPLVHGDSLLMPFATASVDGLVCGFALRNFERLEPFAAECARVLRPGGRIALLEVDAPTSPVLRFGHSLYFRRIVPLVGGLLSDRAAYRYLPASVSYLPPGDGVLDILRSAGFDGVARERLSGGIAQLITAERP